MTSYESAMLLANTLDGKKGEEIKVLKTEGLTTLADYFVCYLHRHLHHPDQGHVRRL